MRLFVRATLVASLLMFVVAASVGARAAQEHEHQGAQHPASGAHHHPAAAKIKNPVPADATSVGAGQKLYAQHCSECHGDSGKGDGMEGEGLDPKPADLTDAQWKHGSTDGEIFVVIRDGVRGTGMKSFGKKLTAHELWDLVNYLRSIGPKASARR